MSWQREEEVLKSLVGKETLSRLDHTIQDALRDLERVELLVKIGAPTDLDERGAWEAARAWLRDKLGVSDGNAWDLEVIYAHLDKDDPGYPLVDAVWFFFLFRATEFDTGSSRARDYPSAPVVEAPAPEHVPVIEPEPEAIGPGLVRQRLERGQRPTDAEIEACTSVEVEELSREFNVKLRWALGDPLAPFNRRKRPEGGPW